MDKATFVQQAPYYYGIAILNFLYQYPGEATTGDIARYYSEYNEEHQEQWDYMNEDAVLDASVRWLRVNGLIDVLEDHFGPTFITLASEHTESWILLRDSGILAVNNYSRMAEKETWVKQTLKSIYQQKAKLKIVDEDFEEPEREWEPIPLDRSDATLDATIQKVDDVIEKLRGDNGYAVTQGEEKRHVLDGLTAFSHTLKNAASVSLPYVRTYAINPLQTMIRRFGKAVPGVAAGVALEALREWLKQKGVDLLGALFR